MTHTPEPCLSKLTAAEFTLLENAGWTHDELALAMPQELADAVRKERLHLSAPDLLAALQAVSDFQQSQMYDGAYEDPVWKQVRAAIAKATGE